MSRWNNKIVIFDLDGTLADITARRTLSTKDDGKMDWDIFFNPDNIQLDLPNTPVITFENNDITLFPLSYHYKKNLIFRLQNSHFHLC